MSWKPFGAKEESETLVDGVPPYMVNSVIDWMGQAELLITPEILRKLVEGLR